MVINKHSKVKLISSHAFKNSTGGTIYVPEGSEVEIVDIIPEEHQLIYTVEFQGAYKELSAEHFTV